MGKLSNGALVVVLLSSLLAGVGVGGEPVTAQPDGEWVLDEIEQNPDGVEDRKWEVALTPTSLIGVVNTGGGNDLESDDFFLPWTVTWDALPERLAPGEEFTRRVTIAVGDGYGPSAGVITNYTSLWNGQSVGIGVNCARPEPDANPVCETNSLSSEATPNYDHRQGQASGDISFTVPTFGDTFEFTAAALNCSAACVTVWRYVWVDGAGTEPVQDVEPAVDAMPSAQVVDAAIDPSDCAVSGSVRVGEFPLRTFSVRMEAGAISATIGTDGQGNFDFGFIDDYGPDGVAAETFQLFFEAEDFTPTVGRVRIYWEAIDAVLATTPRDIEPGNCRVDLDLSAVPDDGYVPTDIPTEGWKEIGLTFRDLADSLKLSDDAGFTLDAVRPLPVLLHCRLEGSPFEPETPSGVEDLVCPDPETANGHFVFGSHIAMVPRREGAVDFGDTVLHEFGHAFMHDVFDDGIPRTPGSDNHGGYWANADTSDSLAEGFADFWVAAVRHDVRQEQLWTRGWDDGDRVNLDRNTKAWLGRGGEARAFAGVLVDLLDGDYVGVPAASLEAVVVDSFDGPGGRHWCGKVSNLSDRLVENLSVRLTLRNSPASAVALLLEIEDDDRPLPASSRLGPGETVIWCGVLEGERADLEVVAEDRAVSDDDSVQVPATSLVLEALVASAGADGSANPETVADLYEGLTRLAGLPADGQRTDGFDGVSQAEIDAVFVSHGFFADMSSRESRFQFDGVASGEVIGRTDHFEAPGELEGVEMAPRRSSDIRGYYWARLNSELPDDVVVTVQVIPDLPTTAAATYSVRPNADGDFLIDAPPDDPGAIVRVYATNPTLDEQAWVTIDEFTSGEWHEAPVQPTGAPMREYEADLSSLAVDGVADGSSGAGAGSGLRWILLIALGLFAAAVALVKTGRFPGARSRSDVPSG